MRANCQAENQKIQPTEKVFTAQNFSFRLFPPDSSFGPPKTAELVVILVPFLGGEPLGTGGDNLVIGFIET